MYPKMENGKGLGSMGEKGGRRRKRQKKGEKGAGRGEGRKDRMKEERQKREKEQGVGKRKSGDAGENTQKCTPFSTPTINVLQSIE